MKPSLTPVLNKVSGSNSFVSSAIYAWGIVRLSHQLVVNSASFSGSVKLQASNDVPTGQFDPYFQPTNWFDIGSSTITASTTASVRGAISPPLEVCYGYIRAVGQASTAPENQVSIIVKTFSL